MRADEILQEVTPVRQIAGEQARHWFSSSGMDLVVWHDGSENITAFQLCYDKPHRERALTWRNGEAGLSHGAVDDGESQPLNYKATPVLVPESHWEPADVLAIFRKSAAELPASLKAFVEEKLIAQVRRT